MDETARMSSSVVFYLVALAGAPVLLLVEHAIAGYAKLGPNRDTERAAATRWLAEHTL